MRRTGRRQTDVNTIKADRRERNDLRLLPQVSLISIIPSTALHLAQFFVHRNLLLPKQLCRQALQFAVQLEPLQELSDTRVIASFYLTIHFHFLFLSNPLVTFNDGNGDSSTYGARLQPTLPKSHGSHKVRTCQGWPCTQRSCGLVR